MGIRRTSHAVYDTRYHLVWYPKYKKKLFAQRQLRERAEEIFLEIADQYDLEIEEMAVSEDHIHLLISFPPRYSISEVVKTMKSISARVLFKEYPSIKKELWNKEIWEDGYFARTVGDRMTADIIERYISNHKTEKQPLSQLDFEL